jgi:beta-lactam-binding protein with PASTA domain
VAPVTPVPAPSAGPPAGPSTAAVLAVPPEPIPAEQVAAAPSKRTGWFFAIIVLLLVVLGGLLFAFGRQLGIFEDQKRLVTVPPVVGLDVATATEQLEDLGLRVDTSDRESDEPPGTVVDQSPAANEQVAEGETVTLAVSVGVGEATLDDLRGLTETDARNRLRDAGFRDVPAPRLEESAEVDAGRVIRTEPAPGVHPKDTQILLVVASAPVETTTTTTTTTAPPTTTTTAPPTTTTTAPPTTTTTAPPTTTTTAPPTTTTTTEP